MSAGFEQRFERKMEFIVDTLASVSARLDGVAVKLDSVAVKLEAVAVKTDETAALVKKLAERQDKTDRQIKAIQLLMKIGMKQMAKTDARIAELAAHTDAKFAEVAEQQKRTDKKFERWLDSRNGSNGHQNGGGKNGGKKSR